MNVVAVSIAGVAATAAVVALTLQLPPIVTVQRGYRGLAIEQVINPRDLPAQVALNAVPPVVDPVSPDGTPSSEVYQNVQVLGDVDSAELTRLMQAMTEWVAPEQGCAFCHADGEDLSSDSLYTKVVARRMLQMTRHINTDWTAHVGATGVTCYTCHRGQPVPANIWFTNPGPPHAQGMAGNKAGQNMPAPAAGYASLPYDPFTPFLKEDNGIRVVSTTALPEGNRHSIKQTEWTYSLMMHMSKSLGVNCTYCHNSRSFSAWDQSSPARSTAWHGIRLVRDVNNTFLESLSGNFPPNRLGPLGDVPKTDCATCHQGAFKPLFGASMLTDYPELRGPTTPAATP